MTYREWALDERRRGLREFVKFAMVGASGVLVNLGVFNLTLLAGQALHGHSSLSAKYLANALGFLVSVLSNYTLNRRWTFRSSGVVRRELPKFFTVSVLAYAANLIVFSMCLRRFHFAPNASQLIAIAAVTPVNFIANKLWSFRRR